MNHPGSIEKTHLSVIIPAYNEADRLPSTLSAVIAYLQEQPYRAEVVVVDDASTDRTADVARIQLEKSLIPGKVLENESNRGKGYSVRRGLGEAGGQIRLFSDADLSTPIREFDNLRTAIQQGADIAIGSRALGESSVEIHQPWYRETMGKGFNVLVRMIAFGGIRDTQCGFKAMRAEFIENMIPHLRVDRWGFDVEILFLALKKGLRIEEVPVRWRDNPNSRVSLFGDSTRMLTDLLRIRWFYHRGVYDAYLKG